ncbi:DHHC zinc finger membrane protein [Purpureocillium lavendulum]|uniref:DHHC zinc finger membrane protein n=1 Tax=Purpureocillium lavendulum TaxID=1247861 RepID=A0AB34G7D4_9HYPO|nr:DHHC zinc finger membrane protein [Purpureocillium lavendulum]
MQLSGLVLAALPAVVLAQSATTSAGASTTTLTSTTVLTKTLTLSKIHTVTASNTTTSATAVGTTSYFTSPTVVPTTGAPKPSVKPDNAAGALDATRVAMAGVVGMLAVALM